MATDVCLTIDVEFTIAGSLHYPDERRPVGDQSVECRTGEESHGLTYMLDVLKRQGLKATFFVETNHVHYFGDGPMGRIVDRLLTDGHDVQLHIHPVWDAFRSDDWAAKSPEEQPSDRFADRSLEEAATLLDEGIATLKRWGVLHPVAFRAGGMGADRIIYAAMRKVGLSLASNVGFGIHRPADEQLHRRISPTTIDEVLEVPVATYSLLSLGSRRIERCLTVVGSSFAEFQAVLRKADRAGAGPVIVLSHPFEFVTADSEYRRVTVQPNVKKRFERMCSYLSDNAERFHVTTFAEAGHRWLGQGSTDDCWISAPPTALLQRYASNRLSWSF